MTNRIFFIFLFLLTGVLNAQEKTREAFIRDFTRERFITWPDDARRKESFVVAIVNDTALFNKLQPLIGKKPLFKKRRLTLKHYNSFQEATTIKSGVIYLNKSEGIDMADAIHAVKGRAILLVGENFPFNQSMINFVSVHDKVSFEYDEDLIAAQGLAVTEELVKLSAKSEIAWNKLLSEVETKLEVERKEIEQKEKQIKSTNAKLANANKNLNEKEQQILEKDEMIDSANQKLTVQQLEIMLKNKENEMKAEHIKEQKWFNSILVVAIILAVLASFFVYRSYRVSRKANVKLTELNKALKHHKDEIFYQKTIVEEKRKEITDSINYALRIQRSLLPPMNELVDLAPDSFIIFKPKDIVSGDFYWFRKLSTQQFLFSVVDCTGHGVPGALMSVIGINQLNKIVNEYKVTSPEQILKLLDGAVLQALHQHNNVEDSNDGMEMAICLYDKQNTTVYYAGAFNPMWIITSRAHESEDLKQYIADGSEINPGINLIEINPDKKSVASLYKPNYDFTLHKIKLNKGDCMYVFSDGFADQFGGKDAKKFKKSRFKELLIATHKDNMAQQKNNVLKAFDDWKGMMEQIDDVCVMGIRV
ncbi:MAG TPA: YfiR/HmsC family protein [Flavobacteriales bacterium]|nr:YfiR/HmsC family protein [Flavobacteriales bacterium]